MSALYRLVRGALRLGLRAYFREIEIHGEENVPPVGPLLILANHHNGMIDPFLLIAATRRTVGFVAKSTLFKVPILGWVLKGIQCMPAYRRQDEGYDKRKNAALYEQAVGFLEEGRALGIFPEGRSHLDPSLREFKHGASRIAFEADAKGLPVRVQLVGIHFERTRGFRGKALLQFGPALELAHLRARYREDPRAAVAGLTGDLHRGLSRMILVAEERELARMADLVERMGVLEGPGEVDLKGVLERKRALLEGYRRLQGQGYAEVEALRRALGDYQRFLDALGVRDGQIQEDYRAGRVFGYALKNTLLLAVGLPLVGAGLVGNLVPYVLSRCLAALGKELDVRTSVGFMAAIFLFPIWWGALAVLGWRHFELAGGVAALASAPLCGAFSLHWFDQWHQVFRATAGLWMALPAARERLRRMRGRIAARVRHLIGLYGKLPPSSGEAPPGP